MEYLRNRQLYLPHILNTKATRTQLVHYFIQLFFSLPYLQQHVPVTCTVDVSALTLNNHFYCFHIPSDTSYVCFDIFIPFNGLLLVSVCEYSFRNNNFWSIHSNNGKSDPHKSMCNAYDIKLRETLTFRVCRGLIFHGHEYSCI